jgi:hypothetical protein
MTVRLLRLEGGCSLEFAPEDSDSVFAAIRVLYGKPTVTLTTIDNGIYHVGGARLLHYSAWDGDDPCLLSQDRRGTAILEKLAKRLGGQSA